MLRLIEAKSILKYAFLITVLFLAGCSPDISRGDPTHNDSRSRVVEIDPAHQSCDLANDCVLAYVGCSGCDCGLPINRKFEDFYMELFVDLCSDYSGAVCEIYCPPVILICKSGKCVVEPSE